MAITSGWTSEIPISELPAGATVPTVAALTGSYNTETYAFWLSPATAYDDVSETAGWTAVGAAAKTALDTYIQAAPIAVDPADTVVARYVLTFVRRGHPTFLQTEYAKQYVASTEGYYVIARIEWKVTPV